MSLGRREVLLWCAGAIALLALIAYRGQGPILYNDSYQYLSVAENLSEGRGLSTSIVHFDVERTRAKIPASLTTFPPGYPIAIAGVSRIGMDRERAGVAISALAYIALFPLLVLGARALELRPLTTRLVLFWLLANSWTTEYPLAVLTESSFTALATGAVIALVVGEQQATRSSGTLGRGLVGLVLGSILVGLSYWFRYAGLLLCAAVLAYFSVALLLRRDRRSIEATLTCSVSFAIIGLGFLRNILIASSWKGGNTQHVVNPLGPVLKELVRSAYQLFFGGRVSARVGAVELGVGLAALAIIVLGFQSIRAQRTRKREGQSRAGVAILWTCLGVYTLGMIYLGVFSVISFGTRMFYPILPVLLLALGGSFEWVYEANVDPSWRRATLLSAVACLTIGYTIINFRSARVAPDLPPHRLIETRLGQLGTDGRPLREWIDANMPADAVVVATDGQGTSYALRRRTVSLVSSEQSMTNWGPAEVKATMEIFGANFLIVYPGAAPQLVPEQRESAFLAALLRGEGPCWLSLAAENPDVKIFRGSTAQSCPSRR